MVFSDVQSEPDRLLHQQRDEDCNTRVEARQRSKPTITVSVRSSEEPCLCTSQIHEEQTLARLANRSTTFIPWTLRLSSLLGFIVFLAALISTLEVLVHISHKTLGLATSTEEDAGYLWKYYPTASKWLDISVRPEPHYTRMVSHTAVGLTLTTPVLSIIAIYWSNLEYHSKILMPWSLLSEEPQKAGNSLRLDYVSLNSLVALWTSIRRRHYPVIAAALGSLAIVFVIVASTGLFVLQPTILERSTTMTISSRFDDTGLDRGSDESFPVMIASSVLSGNLSIAHPPYTNDEFATESFGFESRLNITSKSALVDTFTADMACDLGRSIDTTVEVGPYNWKIIAKMTDGNCTTGPQIIAMPPRNQTSNTELLSVGKVIMQHCPNAEQSKLFMIFAQIKASVGSSGIRSTSVNVLENNSTVIVCTPSYMLQRALVTTDASGAITGAEPVAEPRNTSISGWEMWSTFNNTLQTAAPVFLAGPSYRQYGHGGYNYDNVFAMHLATWSKSPAAYLNAEELIRDMRTLFQTSAAQITDKFLRTDSSSQTTGSYSTVQLRIIFRDDSLRMVEAGLGILLICTVLMTLYSRSLIGLTAGTDLAHLAVLVGQSARFRSQLQRSGIMPKTQAQQPPSGSISCKECKAEVLSPTLSRKPEESFSPIFGAYKGDTRWWKPLALSPFFKILFIILPLAVVFSLEATYQMSQKHNGLGEIPPNPYWHYAWTWTPALIMVIIKLLSQSATASIALLDPYSMLRDKAVAARQSLSYNKLSKSTFQLCYDGCRNKRWILFGAGVSALLSPFLTIVVSGLFPIRFFEKTEARGIVLSDHLLSPRDKSCTLDDWDQTSLFAANFLVTGFGGYPKGTHGQYTFANAAVDPTAYTDVQFTNASALDADLPVIFSNITCQTMDPAGFRYTLESPRGPNLAPANYHTSSSWSGNASYLNFTHPDFAGFSCRHSGSHCDTGIASLGVHLDANSTRFLTTKYKSGFWLERWADVSSWSDHEALVQAIDARNETNPTRPDIFLLYGPWNLHAANISGIACYYDVREGQATATYDLSSSTVVDVQHFIEVSSTSLPSPITCDPMPDLTLDTMLLSKSLWSSALNGSSEWEFDAPANATLLAGRISRIYNIFYSQFYNGALRTHDMTNGLNTTTGVLYGVKHERLFQSEIPTRVLQALLLTMWLGTSLALLLTNTKKLLPKDPCSIAAQASLLAESEFLALIPPGAEHATTKELMEMTPFKDRLFSMGWRTKEDGTKKYGIDVGEAEIDTDGKQDGKV